MMLKRKNILGGVVIALLAIMAIVFIPAIIANNKEDNAALEISEQYGETFAVTKSTASKNLFSNEFTVTLQSADSSIVYDFDVQDDNYSGNYYEEQVNVAINELVSPHVEGLVMSNANVTGLTETTEIPHAGIEKVDMMIITNEEMKLPTAEKILQAVQAQLEEVAVSIRVLIVEDKEAYEGVTYEIKNYFQLSTITEQSFEGLEYETQSFDLK